MYRYIIQIENYFKLIVEFLKVNGLKKGMGESGKKNQEKKIGNGKTTSQSPTTLETVKAEVTISTSTPSKLSRKKLLI